MDPTDKAAAAASVLIHSGAPALSGLAVAMSTDSYRGYAGVAIAGIRKRGIPLTDKCLKELKACSSMCRPSKAAERRKAYIRRGMTGEELEKREAEDSSCYMATAHAMGELAVEDGKLVLA